MHDYLYENAKQKNTLQKLNQALVEESLKALTFNPSIPAASRDIVERYQHGKPTSNTAVEASQERSASAPSKKGKSNMIAGPAVVEYFSKSAAERLSTPKVRDDSSIHKSAAATDGKGKRAATDMKEKNQKPHTGNGTDDFVNRLAYEYKQKEERIKLAAEKQMKFDSKTGNYTTLTLASRIICLTLTLTRSSIVSPGHP